METIERVIKEVFSDIEINDELIKQIASLIKSIIKDMESNRTVHEISIRNRVEKKLTEEILQIYTTHPGIDVSGILDRLKE